jgi:hypothetical protein
MLGAKSRGIPHLAKNERDMGHPAFFGGKEKCFKAVYGTTRFVPDTKTFSRKLFTGAPLGTTTSVARQTP